MSSTGTGGTTAAPASAPRKLVHGLSAFPITPQDAAGVVDEVELRKALAPLIAARVPSIGLLGSTGTYAFLDREQRRRAVEIAAAALREARGRDVAAASADASAPLLLVGVGHLRTNQACLLAQDAAAAGADAGLLSPVSYNPLTPEEVFQHFRAVAEAAPGLPLVIYNNEATTKFKFSPELIARMAAELPTVVGLKYPSAASPEAAAEQHVALTAAVGPRAADFTVGYSRDPCIVESLIAGGEAWFSVFGGLFPRRALALYDLATAAARGGDGAEAAAEAARRENARLKPLWDAMNAFGSLHTAYAVAEIIGVCRAELPRPLLPVGPEGRARLQAALEAAGLATA